MKNLIFSAIVLTFGLIACNSNTENANATKATETTTMDTTTKHEMMKPEAEQKYACSMHPEVIGKKDDTCSICGMNLTVEVKN